jgi:hypothetical protein
MTEKDFGTTEAACFKCKKKTIMKISSPEIKVTKKGLKGLLHGQCTVCGQKACKIVKVSEVDMLNQR